MNRTSGLSCTTKSPTDTIKGGDGDKKEFQNIRQYGHRGTSAVAASSQLPAADRRPSPDSCGGVNNQQGTRSVAASHLAVVPQMAAVASTPASSAQHPAGMSIGARPKQLPQGGARQTGSQAAPVLTASDTRKAGSVGKVPQKLPRQLSERGYRLAGTEPCGQGAIQTVYSLTRKAADGSGILNYVVKFPQEKGRTVALKGINIQGKLARLQGGNQYFVPVVEKVMENDKLVCHVEPKGRPVSDYISDNNKFRFKRKLWMLFRMFEAVKAMHAEKVAHLDIKPDNLIVANPGSAGKEKGKVRVCDFDFAVELGRTDKPMTVPIGTYECMCGQVLRRTPYLPVMADLWAATFTTWALMVLDTPSLHWLAEMLKSPERRNDVLSGLARCFRWPEWNHASESGALPDDTSVISDDCLLDRLRQEKDGKKRLQLQLFFWNNLIFPADIDTLRLVPAEKYVLREMLSIMFSGCSYKYTIDRITSLMTAALRCTRSLMAQHLDHEAIRKIMKTAGYQSCEQVERLTEAIQPYPPGHSPDRPDEEMPEVSVHPGDKWKWQVNDFMVRKLRLLHQVATPVVNENDCRNILFDYLARGGSLALLEAKSAVDLHQWVIREWGERKALKKKDFQPGLAC